GGPDRKSTATAHDLLHTAPKVGTRYACSAGESRVPEESAHLQNALSIDFRVIPGGEHRLVAGAFALGDQSSAQPPDRWVKPEQGFDQHVHGRSEVVPSPVMTEFMG